MATTQTITTKYGTKINVTGLTPEQIKKVRTMSEANGAYGAKGAALAQSFQKTNATTKPAAPGTTAPLTGNVGAAVLKNPDPAAQSARDAKAKQLNLTRAQYDQKMLDANARKAGTTTPPAPPPPPAPPLPGGPGLPAGGEPPLPPNPADKFTGDMAEHSGGGIDNKTGSINSKIAIPESLDAANADTYRNYNMNNPNEQTDALGNKQSITTDPATGITSINKTAGEGLSAANKAFTGAATNLLGANGTDPFKQAYDSTYGYITKDYASQKDRTTQQKQQELADKGIPYSDNPNSRYQHEMGDINKQYQSAYDQASNQAFGQANSVLGTQANVIGSLSGSVAQQNPQFTPYQGGQSNQAPTLLSLLGTISSADMQKYGIDQDTMTKLKQIANTRRPSVDTTSPIIGDTAP